MKRLLSTPPVMLRRAHEKRVRALREEIDVLEARLRECDPGFGKIDHGLLVGGSGSSGTTLLRKLLNRHPDVYCGPEWYVFYHAAIYANFAKLNVQERKWLVTSGFSRLPNLQPPRLEWGRSPDRPMVVNKFVHRGNRATAGLSTALLQLLAIRSEDFWDFATRLFGHLAGSQGKRFWAEKTPVNCRAYSTFLDAHPGNRCVHLVRDGRDVVLSLMKRGFAMRSAVDRWVTDTASYLPLAESPRLLLMRFEDLVEDPAKELTKLLSFSDWPVECVPSMVAQAATHKSEAMRTGASAAWGASPDARVDPSIAGKWKLREAEVLAELAREFERGMACAQGKWCGNDLLSKFGYEKW